MEYILLIVLTQGVYNEAGVSIAMQEFENSSTCESAKHAIVNSRLRAYRTHIALAKCVIK